LGWIFPNLGGFFYDVALFEGLLFELNGSFCFVLIELLKIGGRVLNGM